jgi:uncharacterized surface anchored protein
VARVQGLPLPEADRLTKLIPDRIIDKATGDIIETWISTTEPHIVEQLPPGDYIMRETLPPAGYVIATDVEFSVEPTGEVQKVVMVDEAIQVAILKVSAADNKPLAGARLQLSNPASGTVIATWTSTTAAYTLNALPAGTYTLTELQAPLGYDLFAPVTIRVALRAGVQTFTVADTQTPVVPEEQPPVTKVVVSKVDSASGKKIAGAKLQILDKKTGKVIAAWTTKAGKTFTLHGLKPGTYVLHEVSAPTGYQKAKDITFTVKNTDKVQKVTMKDLKIITPAPGNVGDTTNIILYVVMALLAAGVLAYVWKRGYKKPPKTLPRAKVEN